MKKYQRHGRYFVMLLGVFVTIHAVANEKDESTIRQVEQRQARAWNGHDAVAYADLFAEDGDVVNVLGWWWQGRSEIQSKLKDAFEWVFRDSKLTITDVHTRFLDNSTAITCELHRHPFSGFPLPAFWS